QQQRQERRQASGRREGKTANQAKILLGGFRERSEVSAGKLRNAHQAERERLDLPGSLAHLAVEALAL
ncbi:ABC transporter ATP-binding protein, partial [Pseudomonas aeruginosa]